MTLPTTVKKEEDPEETENPVRAGLCTYPTEYKYSSALLYKTGIDNWGFRTHFRD